MNHFKALQLSNSGSAPEIICWYKPYMLADHYICSSNAIEIDWSSCQHPAALYRPPWTVISLSRTARWDLPPLGPKSVTPVLSTPVPRTVNPVWPLCCLPSASNWSTTSWRHSTYSPVASGTKALRPDRWVVALLLLLQSSRQRAKSGAFSYFPFTHGTLAPLSTLSL